MPSHRVRSRLSWLARAGFAEPATAAEDIERAPWHDLFTDEDLLVAIGRSADPDQALRLLLELVDVADADLRTELRSPEHRTRARLLAVLGSSQVLGHHLVRHPDQWPDLARLDPARRPEAAELRHELLTAVGAASTDALPVATVAPEAARDALRVAYRRRVVHLAALDVADDLPVELVTRELALLADATLEAALAVARHGLSADAAPARLAVVGMGKCGGLELNYVSDVDVVFVAEVDDDQDETAALAQATEVATTMMKVCGDHTPEGTIWPVDAALRPEGKRGPLVRTLDSHLRYYRSWAKTWEFQALLKARVVAGDAELGQRYLEAISPMVWEAAGREAFVDDVRRMRQQVEENVAPAESARQIKLGRGGIRDVEFAVQLLQLVHGRTDETLRSGTTLDALAALTDGGYVGRDDGAELADAYRFLRRLEHRVQLRRLRRTHLLPTDEHTLRGIARSLGLRDAAELDRVWRAQTREVRRLHEKIFYRPLLAAVARLPSDGVRLSTDAARARLVALGYRDPAGALRTLQELTTGVSRRAAIQRTLLPVLLGWFADAPEPDTGLAGFRRVSDALGTTAWYLRLLRDDNAAAERMARVLGSGRYPTELLLRSPDAVQMFGDDARLRARSRASLETEVLGAVRRHSDPVGAIGVVRSMRRRELFRTTVADLVGLSDVDEVGEALTSIAHATLAGALAAATRAIELESRATLPVRIAVVAMGRLGGGEMNYGSDADVMFVHEALPGVGDADAAEAALAVAQEMRRLLALRSSEPGLVLDVDLRPEGRQGPLVRSLSSYATYYRRWSELWERQALLRAAPACGDPDLLERYAALIDPLRWSPAGIGDDDVRAVRRMKARIEAERLPRGADPSLHLKLGPGGQADVEWTVQLIQLRHAGSVASLRTPHTVSALTAATEAGLIDAADAAELLRSWRLASAVRNATMVVTGRASDMVPREAQALSAVSRLLGWSPGESAAFLDEYRRVTRHARTVVERVFYGE